MLQRTPLKFSAPAVKDARARWEKKYQFYRAKHSLGFIDFFRLFNSNVPQIRIAESTGLSRERIRVIYNNYFRTLFEGQSGRERFEAHKALAKEKQELLKSRRREQEWFAALNPIVKRALAAGCAVQVVPRRNNSKDRVAEFNLLAINGHRCLVYPRISHAGLQGGRRLYASVRLSTRALSTVRAVILRTAIKGLSEHVFVIPVRVLFDAYFRPGKDNLALYLPVKKQPSYNDLHPRIDHWQYEDAWHLVAKKSPGARSKARVTADF